MTDPERAPDPARVAELFDHAADRDPAEREAFLVAECAGDEVLKREVMELLRFDEPKPGGEARALPNPQELALTRPEGKPTRDARPRAGVHRKSPELASTELAEGATRRSDATRRAALSERPAPERIGRFEVTGKLGEGGMGVVYSGVDPTLGRNIALKLVRPDRARSGRARMLREAQAMARVAHPNVVPIYETGIHEDGIFFAMELVAGQTLRSWLDEERREWRLIVGRFVEAGRGLAAAHRAGVLHRDFKPDNILIGDDGRVRVLDFGLARAAVGDGDSSDSEPEARDGVRPFAAELTHPGAVMGTPGYMSPEHFEGPLGPWSDQWSFAVALYRALYGSLPFAGDTLDELRKQVLRGEAIEPPSGLVPDETMEIVRRGMERYPEDRFPSLDEMVDALEIPLLTNPELDRAVSRPARRLTALAVGAAGVVMFTILSVGTHFRYDVGMLGVVMPLLVASVVMLVAIVVFRRALLKNTHNRRVIVFFVLELLALNAHRFYALATGLRVVDVVRVDAIFAAALDALAAVALEPWLGWPAGMFVVFFLASLVLPGIVVPGFALCIIGSIALGIWFWREPRRRSSGRSTRSSSQRSERDPST